MAAETAVQQTSNVQDNPHLLQLPNTNRFLVSLAGRNLEWALVRRLGWTDYMYVRSSPLPKDSANLYDIEKPSSTH